MKSGSIVTFRSFAHDGTAGLTVRPSHEIFRAQEHLVPVLDTMATALADRPAHCRFLLNIEDTEPFEVEWTAAGDAVAVARIRRADRDAILIVVADAGGSVNAAAMRLLQAGFANLCGGGTLDAAFDWVIGCGPALAAMAYLRGVSDAGMEMVMMCVAVAPASPGRWRQAIAAPLAGR